MAGLVPAIHVLLSKLFKPWMPATGGHDEMNRKGNYP